MRLRRPFPLALLAALVVAAPAGLAAQFYYLNQNKIQYRRLDWQVLKGPRVDLYYYPAEAELAPVALAYAEESYDVLALKFGHTVTRRIPLIVYASHADFEQTNILPFTPPEGLLGVTDFLKRRVTLPFRGNMAEFRHTLRHEMVHVFQLSLLEDRYVRSPQAALVPMPLWFTEGLAELWSGGEDARDEMILRDLVLSGRMPTLMQLSWVQGGIVYPIGGRIHRWLAETYGDWRVAELYRELWRYESFEAAIAAVYGKTIEQLDEEFQLAMRRAYYPVVGDYASLPAQARPLARGAIKATVAPADSTGPERVVYAAANDGFITYRMQPYEGGKTTDLLTAGRDGGFENFHAFDSRADASRKGLLLFSSRYQERDAVMIYDLAKRELVGRYQFDQLVSILSPVWAPDGKAVYFSGLEESGLSDLYKVELPAGTLTRLTNDHYQDLDPSVSPDGTRLVFASDRTALGLDDAVNLFVLDLASGAIRQLTYGRWVDEVPTWADSNRITFASGRDGVLNIFSTDTLGNGRRETSAYTGAFDAAPVPGQDVLLVGGFHELSLGIYAYPGDSLARRETFTLPEAPPPGTWSWPTGDAAGVATAAPKPYRRKYNLDFAAGGFTYVPRYGTGQGIAFLVSDLLSDNLVFVSINTFQGRRFSSIFGNTSASALYLNQSRRLNWGVGAFRFKGNQWAGDLTVAYRESTAGAFGLLRYPLSRYTRVEGRVVVEHSDRFDFTLPVDNPRREGWLTTQQVSYVYDNSLWISSGPVDGQVLAVTGGITSDFSNARFDNYTVAVDARKYLRLGSQSAFAFRGLYFYSGADRPERVNLGGTLALRGFPNYGYIIGSQGWMANGELRFPLLDYFTLGTPVGAAQFPEIQGAFFADVGRTWFPGEDRATLGSYGVSFRWPLVPGLVLRLDWGRRWSSGDFRGYNLLATQKRRSFLQFFFGYNY